ncbi:MAG: hypothetical protein N3A65_03805 [candidate division WOR-3 bacterium]|nr:hypothetical protein [candidate division WOR-3 bacterium]
MWINTAFPFNTQVSLADDTLKFYNGDSLVYLWILKNYEEIDGSYHRERAKVAPDNKQFLFYEERDFPQKDSIFTRLILYDAQRKKIWSRTEDGRRKICFELTDFEEDLLIIFTTERLGEAPVMEIIKNKKLKKRIDLKKWTSVVDYAFSPNKRYVLFHAKKPYNNRLWDYIYFLDLKTNKSWEYLFPFCFSCKRGRIDLKVDDDGKCEVVYRNEHRIFDKEGNLVDVFVKLD